MEALILFLQLVIALGLLNVWLLRPQQKTPYRGGNAGSMAEEFAAYGLPHWSMFVVGALKILSALALIIGVWVSELVLPAAGIIGVLMVGALAMHAKAKDPLPKFLPAAAILILTLILLVIEGR